MLTQDHRHIVNELSQYIHDHSEERISIDVLANYAGVSRFHLHRIFSAATGFELAEYIQRRKMEKALSLLRANDISVIDVALSVGYDSHSSFSRAFKKAFNLTPSQVLQGGSADAIMQHKKKPVKENVNEELQGHWIHLDTTQVLGKTDKGFKDQSFFNVATALFSSLSDRASLDNFSELSPIGVSLNNPWEGKQQDSSFFAGFLNGLDIDDQTLDTFTWQGGHWIYFEYVGPYHLLWQFVSQVHAQWLIPNRIALQNRQIVQRYMNSPQDVTPSQLRTLLYFPILTEQVD